MPAANDASTNNPGHSSSISDKNSQADGTEEVLFCRFSYGRSLNDDGCNFRTRRYKTTFLRLISYSKSIPFYEFTLTEPSNANQLP
jgi:hypothetical protein